MAEVPRALPVEINVQATVGDTVRGLVAEVFLAEWGKGNSS